MKKSQLRANLLDESAPFVKPSSSQNGHQHHSNQHQYQPQSQGQGHRVHSNGNGSNHAYNQPYQGYQNAPPQQYPPQNYKQPPYQQGYPPQLPQQSHAYSAPAPAPTPAPMPMPVTAQAPTAAPHMQFVSNHPLAQSQYSEEQYYQSQGQGQGHGQGQAQYHHHQSHQQQQPRGYQSPPQGQQYAQYDGYYQTQAQTVQASHPPPAPQQSLQAPVEQERRSRGSAVSYEEYPTNGRDVHRDSDYGNGRVSQHEYMQMQNQTQNTKQAQVDMKKASMAKTAKALLKPKNQIFAIGDDAQYSDDDSEEGDRDVSFLKKKTMSTMSATSGISFDQEKILQLEEKIQRLERVLALQSLEDELKKKKQKEEEEEEKKKKKEKEKEEKDKLAKTRAKEKEILPALQLQAQVGSYSEGSSGAPPLPPPPPPEKKSILSSPKAALFTTEFNTNSESHIKASLSTAKNDALRLSASSLIPSEKSTGDEGDEEDDDEDGDAFGDEPPPSYEELEKSGTITYSKSIYRTGFEKAGYQMDHVKTPTPTPLSANEKDPEKYKMLGMEIPDKPQLQSQPQQQASTSTKVKTARLMSKRKIPSQIDFERSLPEPERESQPIPEAIPAPVPAPTPAPAPAPEPMQFKAPPAPPVQYGTTQSFTSSVNTMNTMNTGTDTQMRSVTRSSTATTVPLTSTTTTNNNNNSGSATFIKYTTPWSFETLPNGVLRPILPSKSDIPFDTIVAKFRKTRDKALSDYKQFTPSVQFQWAILLLETLSKSEIMGRMTIDGKVRKNALVGAKKLRKQRFLFLTTAVKVLEKLVQIAPSETRARLYLGDIYSGGIHPGLIEKDEKRGFELFYDSAVKQMDPVGCYRVACCLESGVGCGGVDLMKSVVFFEKGASLGDPSCMCQLGMMHFAGVNGCVQDVGLSVAYHRQAYDTLRSKTVMGSDPLISARSFQDARGALYTLAKMHQTDAQILCLQGQDSKTLHTITELKENGVWCNKGKSLKYYLESAKLGHSESQACLGYYYSQGYFPTYMFKSDKSSGESADTVDARKSIYWFSKAAAEGHTYASLGLARWYGSGGIDADGKVVLKQDEQQAFLWGRKAADAGELVEAEFMIGMCFEQGFGVEKNMVMAVNYYERSARKGYKKAIAKLKAIAKRERNGRGT